jgi:TusA-related sulfurtransferase
MTPTDLIVDPSKIEQIPHPPADGSLGEAFLLALAAQDFDRMEKLFQPEIRFRALVPSGERMGNTATEALRWLRKWFGGCDSLKILSSAAQPVFDRYHMNYRLRVHDNQDGWRVIEQQVYYRVQDSLIADMWLICSGFRPDPDSAQAGESRALPGLNGNVFYDAGARGCAEGPLEEIARLLRSLAPGQTLEVHATDVSVATDLPAWCRMSGNELVTHVGDEFLIRRT